MTYNVNILIALSTEIQVNYLVSSWLYGIYLQAC